MRGLKINSILFEMKYDKKKNLVKKLVYRIKNLVQVHKLFFTFFIK